MFVIFTTILSVDIDDEPLYYKFIASFPIFRFALIMCLIMWLWGWNVYVFDVYRINYAFILEADQRTVLNYSVFLILSF